MPAAQYDVRITGTSGITGSDLTLDYAGNPVTLAGTASAGDAITGSFGSFSPPDALDSAPSLSLAATTGSPDGTLQVATALDEVAPQSGASVLNTIATATNDVAVVTNTPPVATDDSVIVAATQATEIDLTDKATDADSDPLTYSVVTDGTKGNVTFNGATATYTPTGPGTPTGTDTFTYKVNDGTDDSNVATVTVTFNTVPTASDDAAKVSTTQPTTIDLSSDATDGDSDPLTYSVVTDGAKGHVTFAGSIATYTPNAPGTPDDTDTFTYRVFDGIDFSNIATVTVTFNTKPAASADAAKVSPIHRHEH